MGVVKSVRRVRKLQGHMNGVVCVHFDKKRLISAGLDRCIRLWDVRSGQSIHKFYGHKGGVRCLQFEGNTLVTGSWDTTLIVWDLKTFEKKAILGDHRGCVSCVQMHHKYMTLRLTNVETEQCLHVFENGQNQVLSVLIQGDLLLSADTQGHVYFWNARTGQSEAAIQAHDAAVNKIAFHKGRFFTAASDCTVREWDLLTMTSVRVLQGHKGPIRDVKVRMLFIM
nr:F-box/WD repeat-containing protein 7-like [Crassostrea gigas]